MAFTIRVFTDEDFSVALAAVKAGMCADGEPLYWGDEEFHARLMDPRVK